MPVVKRPWTYADSATLRRLHEEGKTAGQAAREMNRAASTISMRSDMMGISWDRSRTLEAVEALKADAAERRARLAMRHIQHAERVLDKMEAEAYEMLAKEIGGADVVMTLDFVPANELRLLTLAAKLHEEAAIKLDLHDAPRPQSVEVSGPGGVPLVTDGHEALMAALGALKNEG